MPDNQTEEAATLLLRSLESVSELSPEARDAISSLPLRLVSLEAGQDLVREGDHPTESCLVLSGFVCRYKIVGEGLRQILSFHLPGEIPDLQSLHLKVMDHSVCAMVPGRVAYIPHEAIMDVSRRHDDANRAFWRETLVDAAIFREWIANVGRRNAYQRIAHLFCEAYVRMRALGLADARGFELPMTQAELGDAVGLTTVHVNRTLQEMRRDGLIESRGRFHGIHDWERLKRVGDFNAAYLQLRQKEDY